MAASKGMLLLVQLMLLLVASVSATKTAPNTTEDLNCNRSCGDLIIPYPFGIGPKCYLDEYFNVTCEDSEPKVGMMPLLNVSLEEGEIRVMKLISRTCYKRSSSKVTSSNFNSTIWLPNSFSISTTKNKFTAIGCDTVGFIEAFDDNVQKMATGCVSQCSNISQISDGNCSGIGCCQTSIPKGVGNNFIYLKSNNNHSDVLNFNPCDYAFVVEEGSFHFSRNYLRDWNIKRMPVVLDWTIANTTCKNAQSDLSSYACGEKSDCHNRKDRLGYICKCSVGYQGNPYLSNGCQDIDECKNSSLNTCVEKSECINEPAGNYTCRCPKGYKGDGRNDGSRCISVADRFLVIQIMIGFAVGATLVLLSSSWLYWIFRKRKLIRLKEKFFRENGGLMLQHKLTRQERSTQDLIKIFTSEELKAATNNYDEGRIVGRGGNGTVYKGILSDNRTVAVKKSNQMVDKTQIEQFINEVVVLSQINHRNVVKLLGCCLETQVPLLVYEFITNGTLFHHVHSKSKDSTISWETRLRIGSETAGVLSYLHSQASVPIIHRDVKTTNILLDDNYTAKVSDFGASRLVPIDENQIATVVQGTLGYLDPEYLQTSQLTEKSDVYSFGVVLVELITGKTVLSADRPEEERCLANYFLSSLKNDRLYQAIDEQVVMEGNRDQIKEVADLAKRCLKVRGEERPTMREVAMELEGLIRREMEKHPWVNIDLHDDEEETKYLLGETSSIACNEFGHSSNTAAGYDSLRALTTVPVLDGGR